MNITRIVAALVLSAFASGCTPAGMVPPTTSTTHESRSPDQKEEVPLWKAQKHDDTVAVAVVGGVVGAGVLALVVYGLVSAMKSVSLGPSNLSF